ncbi:glycosyltransferase 36 [Lentisphaera araneosa HTCC2155]|uniref:Glycosyltransferase 36 n=1 Tax=Lentisphaera araneosa HTCC2155 TaxID=313628 RepID=A6DKD5_9BACT|nr:glucoamylase family protein [Lentisphaera araneosa]EDM27833.1 glycosyltransferase 36 [Lentisphaera araneosa HTCC2155]
MKNILFLLSCIFLILQVKAQNSTDRDFLRQVHADTWNCLDAMIDPTTGFPQDTQFPGGHTNTTNIGLYLASLCVAVEKGLTTHQHGFQRAEKILSSLESFERVHGFTPHILDVQLRTKTATGYVAISDFNKLIVGLIMVKQVWPELCERIDHFTQAVEWEKLYHKETGNVSWGYDFDSDRTLGEGHLWLPADTRSAAFLMIATGAAPAEMWAEMDRTPLYTPYGKILRGYGMGGLFMMAMDSLFLPEISSEMGESSGNFAWQQIQFSKQRGYPFWGWSNCYMPGKGYTEGGHLSEQVVTPHALALMIEYYPKHVTQALRGLAKTGGMQGPQGFENVQWGFRDAYDMKSKQWDHRYLSLDQGMLFLALSNYLQDGIVRKIYHADPLVQKGLKLIAPYLKPNQEFLKLWAQRDAQVDRSIKPISHSTQTTKIIPDLAKPLNSPCLSASKNKDKSIQLNFESKEDSEPHHFKLKIPTTDMSNLKALEIEMDMIKSSEQGPDWVRLLILDRYNQLRYTHIELQKHRSVYRIEADDLLGIHIDENNIKSLELVFWKKPWYYQNCKINSDSISLNIKSINILK